MKEAGLGTPATRAETIEKLIRVSYIERLGKQLRATSKGRQAIALLGDHALTSAELTGRWEKRLSDIEHGAGARDAFMDDIRDVHLGDGRVLPRALLRRRARAPRARSARARTATAPSARTGSPTAARRGRAARSPAAASSSGSSRRAARSRPPRPASCSRRARPSSWTGSRPGRAGRGWCSPRETRCSSSPTTAPASTLPPGRARRSPTARSATARSARTAAPTAARRGRARRRPAAGSSSGSRPRAARSRSTRPAR